MVEAGCRWALGLAAIPLGELAGGLAPLVVGGSVADLVDVLLVPLLSAVLPAELRAAAQGGGVVLERRLAVAALQQVGVLGGALGVVLHGAGFATELWLAVAGAWNLGVAAAGEDAQVLPCGTDVGTGDVLALFAAIGRGGGLMRLQAELGVACGAVAQAEGTGLGGSLALGGAEDWGSSALVEIDVELFVACGAAPNGFAQRCDFGDVLVRHR